jgi:hypothetical protein
MSASRNEILPQLSSHLRRQPRGILLVLLAVVFLCGQGVQPSAGLRAFSVPRADRLSQRLVFAELHPWGTTPTSSGYFARWNETGHNPLKNDIVSTVWPARGLYSMADCSTVAAIGEEMWTAGIDVAMITWVDLYPEEASRVGTILRCIGDTSPMRAVVMVDIEPEWHPETWAAVRTRVSNAVAFATTPPFSNYYYRDPVSHLPVYVVYDPGGAATMDQWNVVIDGYKATPASNGIFVAGLGYHSPFNRSWQGAGLDHVTKSSFDGFSVLAGKNAEVYTPTDPTTSDVQNYLWAIWQVYGQSTSRNQFIVGQVIPGFDNRANCHEPRPVVVDRQNGAVFDRKWANLIAANWNGRYFDHASVAYDNDGEDNGIAPISNTPPVRGSGYASCGGRLAAQYTTHVSHPNDYLTANRRWALLFKMGAPRS